MPGYANPQALNRYSYVLNNPIKLIDPSGHKCVGEAEECLDDDGNPINGVGELENDNQQEEPGHDYESEPHLGCLNVAWIDCTEAEFAEYMTHFQYPGQWPGSPVIDGMNYDVWPARLWGIPNVALWLLGISDSGAIRVDIGDDPLTISNFTQESHVFNVGDVERTGYQLADGNWYVSTQGDGTNDGFELIGLGIPGPFLDDVNEVAGPIVFTALDIELLIYTTVVETGQYIEAQVSGSFP